MSSPARALVVGPGAVGLVLAQSLRRAGVSVSIADRRLSPRPGRADVVFLCVKAAGLRWAIRAARPHCGPETAVVSLLNGVGHVQPLRAAFGPRAVLGTAYFAALRTAPGRAKLMGGRAVLLAREDANVPAAEAARAMLARAGWDVRLRADRARMLWTKLALNAAINPLGALACVTNGALARDPALKDLLTAVCREAAAAARAAGCPLSASSLSRRVLRACRATPEQRNSTLQDLDAGRRTEIREILLPLLKAARKTGQEAPILSSLYKMTVSLETSLAGAAR